jgi:hypothetical protein
MYPFQYVEVSVPAQCTAPNGCLSAGPYAL